MSTSWSSGMCIDDVMGECGEGIRLIKLKMELGSEAMVLDFLIRKGRRWGCTVVLAVIDRG